MPSIFDFRLSPENTRAMAIKWGTGITVLLTVLAGLWYCYSGFRDAWRQRKKELHATLSAD